MFSGKTFALFAIFCFGLRNKQVNNCIARYFNQRKILLHITLTQFSGELQYRMSFRDLASCVSSVFIYF